MIKLNEILDKGIKYHKDGNLLEAEKLYRQILVIDPNYPDALHLWGIIAHQVGKHDVAINLIKQALTHKPTEPLYNLNMGLCYESLNKKDEALQFYLISAEFNTNDKELYKKITNIKTHNPNLLLKIGNFHNREGRLKEAIDIYNNLLLANPKSSTIYNNLASTIKDLEGPTENVVYNFEKSIKLEPNSTDALYNLGVTLLERGEVDASLVKFKNALAIDPNYTLANIKIGEASLLIGDFQLGWENYNYRLKLPGWNQIYPHVHTKSLWNGKSFKGKRLLVHGEQGFGDTIQFIRYLPLIKKLGGTVLFETRKPLINLFKDFSGIDELLERTTEDKSHLNFDFYTYSLSLPQFFTPYINSIPCEIPYIFPNSEKQKLWKNKISSDKFKVGIAWSGSPDHNNDKNRSCNLKHFLPLFNIPEIKYFSLQKGDANLQIKEIKNNIKISNLGDYFNDFTDTAAAIANLDLVISVDTAIVHLAGAMGKKVWLLLPIAPDWRWMLKRSDTPWYPTIRLFRQPKHGDWESVFSQVEKTLLNLDKKS